MANLKMYGNRAYSAAGQKQWNKLPLDIRQSSLVTVFETKLKTYLFKDGRWIWNYFFKNFYPLPEKYGTWFIV